MTDSQSTHDRLQRLEEALVYHEREVEVLRERVEYLEGKMAEAVKRLQVLESASREGERALGADSQPAS